MAPMLCGYQCCHHTILVYIYNFIRSSVYMPYTHIWKTLDRAFPRYKISIYGSDLIIPKSATGNMQY